MMLRPKTRWIIPFLLFSVFSCQEDKNSPEYITQQYLLALKNKDWEKAKSYLTYEAKFTLDIMVSLGVDFGVTQVKDIKCDTRGKNSDCTFCCSSDTNFVIVNLKKEDEKWKIVIHPWPIGDKQ